MMDSPRSSSEVKILPFSHLMALKLYMYDTNGIRARVEKLGPNWAQNAPTHFVLDLHVYSPWRYAGDGGTITQNNNKDDPLPCELNVRPECVSTQVSGYSLDHLRICLQITKMIALSLF